MSVSVELEVSSSSYAFYPTVPYPRSRDPAARTASRVRNRALEPPLLDTGSGKGWNLFLSPNDPRIGDHGTHPLSTSIVPRIDRHSRTNVSRRLRHYDLLSSPARASLAQIESSHRTLPDLLRHVQRLRIAVELGWISSPAPREGRYSRRYLESELRRVLVGASALALPVCAGERAEMVPRFEPAGISILEPDGTAGDPTVAFLRFVFRVAGVLLAGSDSLGLFTAHAVFRE